MERWLMGPKGKDPFGPAKPNRVPWPPATTKGAALPWDKISSPQAKASFQAAESPPLSGCRTTSGGSIWAPRASSPSWILL